MIKEIFLPEKIGSRRLLAQRIVGASISHDCVCLAVVNAKSSVTIIEQLTCIPLSSFSAGGSDQENQEFAALKKAFSLVKYYDQVRVAIPSSLVVFKELEVPFIESDKIRMVLDYEVESILPFSIEYALVDFIVTKVNKEQNSSQVLVAALRKADLQSVLSLYTQAGINPVTISLDLFSLYSLYQQIPEYSGLEDSSALVDFDTNATRISFLFEGQLRLTRYIPRGLLTIVKGMSADLKISEEEIEKKLLENGVRTSGDNNFDASLKKQLMAFFNDVQFTLNSFSLKLNYYKGVKKILFTGRAALLPGLMKFSNEILQTPCELFDTKKIVTNKLVKSKIKNGEPWNHAEVALGAALPSLMLESFNLRQKEFAFDYSGLIKKQIIAAGIVTVLIFSAIALAGYQQITSLSSAIEKTETREVSKLVNLFPRQDRPKSTKIAAVMSQAEKLLNQKKDLWTPFAQERVRPLEVLLELTSIMDKKLFSIDSEEITIKESSETRELVIEIEGYFQSKRGAGSHFQEFEELQERFEKSSLLTPAEPITPRFAAERGIQFSIKLKRKIKEE